MYEIFFVFLCDFFIFLPNFFFHKRDFNAYDECHVVILMKSTYALLDLFMKFIIILSSVFRALNIQLSAHRYFRALKEIFALFR